MNKKTVIDNLRWITKLVLGFALFIILGGVAEVPFELSTSPTVIIIGCSLLSIAVLQLYKIWVWKVEKRSADELKWSNMPSMILKGFAIGFGFFSSVVLIMALLGAYRIANVRFDLISQLQGVAFFLSVAACEEITFRGFLFRMLDEKYGFWIATAVSAITFGFIHLTNDHATWWSATAIVLEIGFFFGAIYKYTGSLWVPIGIHWIWNYMQGNVYGFAVSGNNIGDSILTPVIEGNNYITGGEFGAEGSVIAATIGVIISVYLIKKLYDKGLISAQRQSRN